MSVPARNKNKIENFAFNIDRPFCADEAAEACGVSLSRTKGHLKDLREEGKIEVQRKVINKYFYVWNLAAKKVKRSKLKVESAKLKVEKEKVNYMKELRAAADWCHENKELYYARMG